MKKIKFLSLLVFLIFTVACVFSLVACSDVVENADSLTLSKFPDTDFTQLEQMPDNYALFLNFELTAVIDGQTRTLSYRDYASQILISDFDLTVLTEGTPRVCTITYSGMSVTFQYNVIAPVGDGTENNPYLINSYLELAELRNDSSSLDYYKLTRDIDCTSFNFEENNSFFAKTSFFNLDGNNHKISFANNTGDFRYIFRTRYGRSNGSYGYIKNVTFDFSGDPISIMYSHYRDSVFENVNVTGNMQVMGNNYGSFCIYNYGGVKYKNCTNSANITGTSPYLGGFVGFANGRSSINSSTYYCIFENCDFAGNLFGVKAAAFCANSTLSNYCRNVSFINCKVSGTITGLVAAKYMASTNFDADIESGKHAETYNISAIDTQVTGSLNDVNNKLTAEWNDDLTLRVVPSASIGEVKEIYVIAFFYGTGFDGTMLIGTKETLTPDNLVYSSNWIKKYKVRGATADEIAAIGATAIKPQETWTAFSTDETNYFYYHDNSATFYDVSGTTDLSYYAVAVNNDNEIIGCVQLS